jgi:hypothetical protein
VLTIQDWCEKHIGRRLEVTCQKDFAMIELWDDRCVQVVCNTGKRVDAGLIEDLQKLSAKLLEDLRHRVIDRADSSLPEWEDEAQRLGVQSNDT